MLENWHLYPLAEAFDTRTGILGLRKRAISHLLKHVEYLSRSCYHCMRCLVIKWSWNCCHSPHRPWMASLLLINVSPIIKIMCTNLNFNNEMCLWSEPNPVMYGHIEGVGRVLNPLYWILKCSGLFPACWYDALNHVCLSPQRLFLLSSYRCCIQFLASCCH